MEISWMLWIGNSHCGLHYITVKRYASSLYDFSDIKIFWFSVLQRYKPFHFSKIKCPTFSFFFLRKSPCIYDFSIIPTCFQNTDYFLSIFSFKYPYFYFLPYLYILTCRQYLLLLFHWWSPLQVPPTTVTSYFECFWRICMQHKLSAKTFHPLW